MNELISSREASLKDHYAESRYDDTQDRGGLPVIEQFYVALVNYRKWVIGIIVACLLLGLLTTFLSTPQYTSTARIEILPDAPVATTVEGEREGGKINELAFYNTQYSLLESRSLAERVVRAGNLTGDKAFIAAFKLDASDGSMTSGERRDLTNRAAEILLDQLRVTPVRTSSLVDVSFSTASPQLSAKLADLWVTQFVQASVDRRFAATTDARKYLETRLEGLRQNLEASERALIGYTMEKGIVTISSETDASGKTKTQTLVASDVEAVSKGLAEARQMRIAAEAELSNTQTGPAQVSAPALAALRQKRAETAAELARLLTVFAEDYPTVASMRAEVANLDRSIATETARSTQGNREAYGAAVKRERELQSELDRLTQLYNFQQRESIQMAILQRDVDSNRELYDGLLQRYKEIGASGVGANNISVVDRAKIATKPSSPNIFLNLALALLLGVSLAAALLLVLEKLDSSVRDPQDVVGRFGLPLLGAIPEVVDRDVAEAVLDKKSTVYEAYFSLMTNLTFLTEHGAPRSIMITSSRPKEGKSNSALSIATVFAAAGKNVVLVDADVRNPSLNRYLHMPNTRGLSHYLSGDEDLPSMITRLPEFGFSIISAGIMPPNAAELLGSERFAVLIDTLLTQFDHVIVDSPPLLGLADAPLIARRVEGVLFTIEANSTKNRAISTALTRLRMSGAKLFGAIVTKVGAKNQIYGYGYGYGYGYSYGSDEKKG